MKLFMARYTSKPLGLLRLYIPARAVCTGQSAGGTAISAMGRFSSVTYATIFMIWLETPIIGEFRAYISLYKRF